MHGGAANNRGSNNGNYQDGGYSKYFRADLTPVERNAYEDLLDSFEDPDETLDAIRELAAEVLLKYKRTGDDRFLREFRQLADTFNLAPNADQLEVDADVDTNAGLDDETKVALREALRSRREDDT
jgi:uncharacterized protein Yka (UPF0111/DUF47 family)